MYSQIKEWLPVLAGFSFAVLIHVFNEDSLSKNEISASKLSEKARPLTDHELFNEVKIACLVLTLPRTHERLARNIHRTWGKRCNKLIFFSNQGSKKFDTLGVVELPVTRQRGYLWNKTREALKYTYENHLNDVDWFYLCNDETYAIVENMRSMVYSLPSSYPIAFGFKLHDEEVNYFFYDTGILFSKRALEQLVETQFIRNSPCDMADIQFADVQLGYCLKEAGVVLGNDADSQGRRRFLPFGGQNFTFMAKNFEKDHWIWQQLFYRPVDGLGCCSNRAVAIGPIEKMPLYEMEFYLYHLKIFGKNNHFELGGKMSLKEVDQLYNITETPVKLIDGNEI